MKFSKVEITEVANNYINIKWDYDKTILENNKSYIIRLSVGASPTGPFEKIVDLPLDTINYNYLTESRGHLTYYFEISILDKFDHSVVDNKIQDIDSKKNLIVEKLRKKYRLLLNKKVAIPASFYKRKKVGHRCKECWDFVTQQVKKSNCQTCFDTSYGNVTLIDNLRLDGILKIGTQGKLEFYKRDFTFNYYEYSTDTASVKSGDIFQIETSTGEIILSTKIDSVNTNYLILESTDESIINKISNAVYSIYRLIDTDTSGLLVNLKILKISDTQARVYGLSTVGTILKLDDNEYDIVDSTDDYLVIEGDLSLLKQFFTKVLVLEDEVLETLIPTCIMYTEYSTDYNVWFSLLDDTFLSGSNFYIDYNYSGNNMFKINGKQTLVGESNLPEASTLGLFTFNTLDTNTYTTDLVTLSQYESIFSDDKDIFDVIFNDLFKSKIYLTVQKVAYAKAMEQIEIKLNPNTNLKLPHNNIIKESFRGCGVLLINLKTGVTYAGQTWEMAIGEIYGEDYGTWYGNEDDTYGDENEIFVDPVNGVINTRNIPKGTYEIKYIYETKNIVFSNTFLPINGKFTDKLDTVSYWILRHKKLINAKFDIKSTIVSVGHNNQYNEFEIEDFKPGSGTIVLKNHLTNNDLFWRGLTSGSFFSLELKNSGGYYNKQEGFINVLNFLSKQEAATPDGLEIPKQTMVLTTIDVNLDPGDLVYDENSKIFSSIAQVTPLKFKSQITAQTLQLAVIPYHSNFALNKLLSR